MNGTLVIAPPRRVAVVAAARWRRAPAHPPAARPVANLKPLLIALGVHIVLAAILAAIPLSTAPAAGGRPSPTVQFQFAGLAGTDGHPAAGGGAGDGTAGPLPATAPPLRPATLTATFRSPRLPVTVIGVGDPLAPTTVAHLNIQLGDAPLPGEGAGLGRGSGSGIGDGREAGFTGAGGAGGLPAGRRNPKPQYPELARLRGWEGTTTLVVEIQPDGTVGRVEIRQSSGHRILDDTCVATVRTWEFEPQPVVIRVEIPVSFRLKTG